jgi:predicted SprT family Zn-dependent metalloprotease
MEAMGCVVEPTIPPRIQFRRDMTTTLMAAHYQVGGDSLLLTINRTWYLKASKADIRSVVRHEMVHFALARNKKPDHHGPIFVKACTMVHGDHK